MGPLDRPAIRMALTPAGWIYAGAVSLRNALYSKGILETRRIGIPVVSVGNLTLGGSGKTPFVATLAARLCESGRRVVVASRGYGGRRSRSPIVVSTGSGPLVGAGAAGDEAVLLASLLPSVVVVVSPDRAAGALLARDRFGSEIVLLDDGFQHRRLHRDLDLLLVDGGEGLGNGRMLPFGPLREPLEEIRRADAVVIVGAGRDLPGGGTRMREILLRHGLEIPVFLCDRRHEGFLSAETESLLPLATLKGMRVAAFSGIAKPAAFEEDLRRLGIDLVVALRFRDHQPYGSSEISRIHAAAKEAGADLLVTTEKDRARLGPTPLRLPLYALRIRAVLREEEAFWSFLSGRIPQTPLSKRSR